MAEFWNILRNEVRGTVDEFREKGVVGAFRDAALDGVDIIKGAGETVYNGVQTLMDGTEGEAVLRVEGVPTRGSFATLEFADGMMAEATVVDIDGVSDPPRARVTIEGVEEPFLVDILPPGVERAEAATSSTAQSLFHNLRQEWNQTVQDFREKGAVGAMKDAALDAMDLVGNTAQYAYDGAKSIAGPLVQDGSPGDAQASGSTSSLPAAEQAAGGGSAPSTGESGNLSLLEGLKSELKETVQDFREKGAVGAVKDAALDAMDLVGNTAQYAYDGAKSIAGPLVQDVSAGVQTATRAISSTAGALTQNVGAPAPEAPEGSAPSAMPVPAAAPVAEQPKVASQQAMPSAAAVASAPVANPVAAAPAAPQPRSVATNSTGAAKPASPVVVPARMQPKDPSQGSPTSSEMPAAGAKPKSLVSMRRNMFEKPKASEPKKEAEEVID